MVDLSNLSIVFCNSLPEGNSPISLTNHHSMCIPSILQVAKCMAAEPCKRAWRDAKKNRTCHDGELLVGNDFYLILSIHKLQESSGYIYIMICLYLKIWRFESAFQVDNGGIITTFIEILDEL